ncbi:hypothetical protein ACHAPE_002197 [Trichoderma viride]
MDDITRHAFSSVKGGRLPESVAKIHENRKEKSETMTMNARKTYFDAMKGNYRQYRSKRDDTNEDDTPNDFAVHLENTTTASAAPKSRNSTWMSIGCTRMRNCT